MIKEDIEKLRELVGIASDKAFDIASIKYSDDIRKYSLRLDRVIFEDSIINIVFYEPGYSYGEDHTFEIDYGDLLLDLYDLRNSIKNKKIEIEKQRKLKAKQTKENNKKIQEAIDIETYRKLKLKFEK